MSKKPVDILLERALKIMYDTEDTLEDWRDAVQLLEQCASLGSSQALVILGDFYRFNAPIRKSPTKSIEFYKKAALDYNVAAYVGLICTYANELRDIENSVKIFRVLMRDIEFKKIKLPMTDDECEQIHTMSFCLLSNCLGKFDESVLYGLHPQIIRGIKVIDFRSKEDDRYYVPSVSSSITMLSYWLRLNAIKHVNHDDMAVFKYLAEIDIIASGFANVTGASKEDDLNIAKKIFPIDNYIDST